MKRKTFSISYYILIAVIFVSIQVQAAELLGINRRSLGHRINGS